MMPTRSLVPLVAGAVAVVVLAALAAMAKADVFESFESPETSWQLAEADCAVQRLDHRRTFQQYYQGQGSEYLHLHAGSGTYVYLTHSIPPARLIRELSPSVWVKSDRPGLRLLLRVVLPRTPVGHEGEVLKTLLRGDSYTDVGNWQRLALTDLPTLMAREVAMLRTRFGPQVDAREAYADLVVLNAFGGSGQTRVWIDNLEVAGIAGEVLVGSEAGGRPAASPGGSMAAGPVAYGNASGGPASIGNQPSGPAAAADMPPRVEIQGDVLSVDGRPRFLRAIEHRGESLEFLQGLGFNAVRLARPADARELRDAERLGLWLIAPPPLGAPHEVANQQAVLIWDTGEAVGQRDVEAVRQLVGATRMADRQRRPFLTIPHAALLPHSRTSDIVALSPAPRPLTGGGMELADYGRWLEQQKRLVRPGMPCWAVLPTQLPQAVSEQWRGMAPGARPSDAVEPQQLELLAYQALSGGARGLLFTSRERLDGSDSATVARAATLQALNQQLHLLEPWVAAGSLSREFEWNESDTSVALLKTDRSVLALLAQCPPQAQFVAAPVAPRRTSLVVRGLPASAHAFSVSPMGLASMRAERQGGMRLVFDDFRHWAAVVITQDPLVINHLSQTIRSGRPAAARTQRELAARMLALTQRTLAESSARPPEQNSEAATFEQAQAYLRRSELLLDSGDDRGSFAAARKSLELQAEVRRNAWESAARGFPAPTSSPACAAFASLPLHWQLAERLRGAQWDGNRLPGGDMENLDFLRQVGWRQYRTSADDVQTLVELTPQAPRGGGYSLRLVAGPSDSASSRLILEEPAIRIESAPVRLWPGQLVQIRGWAKVRPAPLDERLVSGSAPLRVYDSFAGEALAQRVIADNTWREFVLYRMATSEQPLTVSLSFDGYGEVLLDDLTVTPLLTPTAKEQAPRVGRR